MTELNPVWMIQKKRDGGASTTAEIEAHRARRILGKNPRLPGSRLSSWPSSSAAWTLTRRMALTRAMVDSGERYDLSSVSGPKVDKHSTGGVGDKVEPDPRSAGRGLRTQGADDGGPRARP